MLISVDQISYYSPQNNLHQNSKKLFIPFYSQVVVLDLFPTRGQDISMLEQDSWSVTCLKWSLLGQIWNSTMTRTEISRKSEINWMAKGSALPRHQCAGVWMDMIGGPIGSCSQRWRGLRSSSRSCQNPTQVKGNPTVVCCISETWHFGVLKRKNPLFTQFHSK